jgi:hypothetical protein
MSSYVDTQEALIAWIVDMLPGTEVRPAGEAIRVEPEEPLLVLNLGDRGDPGYGGPFFTARGVIQIYGPGDIQAAALYDQLLAATSTPDGWYTRSGITIRNRWYAQYIKLGGATIQADEGPDGGGDPWPVLVATLEANIDRRRGA